MDTLKQTTHLGKQWEHHVPGFPNPNIIRTLKNNSLTMLDFYDTNNLRQQNTIATLRQELEMLELQNMELKKQQK